MLQKLWDIMNGKKVVVSAVLKAIADVASAAGYPEVAEVVDIVGNTLLTIGLAHKGVKQVKK